MQSCLRSVYVSDLCNIAIKFLFASSVQAT